MAPTGARAKEGAIYDCKKQRGAGAGFVLLWSCHGGRGARHRHRRSRSGTTWVTANGKAPELQGKVQLVHFWFAG